MSDPGDASFWFGSDREKYDPNSPNARNAASMNGAYGSTGMLQQAANGALGRQGPTAFAANAGPASMGSAASLNTQNYDQVRGGQMGLTGMLTQTANGQGPSGAGMAAQAQRDSALSQAAALQSGRRGQTAAAGAANANLSAQMGNQQASQNEAIGRANEMATARGQLGSVYGQIAGQDIGVAGQNAGFGQQMSMFNAGQQQNMGQFNAGLQQQTNLANQQANLSQQGLNNGLFLGGNAQLQNESQAEMNARLQEQQLYAQSLNPGSQGVAGSLIGAAGALGAAALMAKGGYVDHPTAAVIGEAGPELVVPLSPGHEGMQDTARHVLDSLPHAQHTTLGPKNSATEPGDIGLGRKGGQATHGVRHFADGGLVDPGMQYLQRAPMPSPYIPRGMVDPRDQGEKAGEAFAGALQQIGNILIAKKMGDNSKKAQQGKDDKSYNDMLKRNGGYTDDQIRDDPQAAAYIASRDAQKDAARIQARNEAFARAGLDPVTGQPIPRPKPATPLAAAAAVPRVGGVPNAGGGISYPGEPTY